MAMDLLWHDAFQTVEFGLLVLWAGWTLLGREVTWKFLALWGLAGLLVLKVWGDQVPTLPFFVSFWRIVMTVFGTSVLGEYLAEWRQSGTHLPTHLIGIFMALAGVVLSWWANWEVAGATLLIGSFIGLGYCARANRGRPKRQSGDDPAR